MGDSITVKTELGDVVVRKMPLIDYAELLKAFDTVPKSLMVFIEGIDSNELKKMTNMDYALLLPSLLANSWPDLIAVVAVPTDKDAEFMGQLDLADAVDVVAAILELNDLPRIMGAIKKVRGLSAKLSPARPKLT